MSGTHDIEALTKSIENRVKEEIKQAMLKQIGIQKDDFRIAKGRSRYMDVAFAIDRIKTINDLMFKCDIISFGEWDNINHEILKLKNE